MILRTLRLGCIAGASALAVALVAGPVLGATTTPVTLPANFAGVASASGLFEHLDSAPSVVPTSQPFFASFGDGNSTYASETLTAEASPYNPGATVVGLGGLICTASGNAFCSLPPYPLIAVANTQTPSASVNFVPEAGPAGGALTVGTLTGTAHATQDGGVTTQAQVNGLGEDQGSSATSASILSLRTALTAIVGHPIAASSGTALLSIGSLTGTTSQAFSGSTLTVTAEGKDSDISLLGGIIHIASVDATSTSTTDGAKVHTHVDDAAISGVTVAGLPATIDQNGVTLSGTGAGATEISAVNAALQQALTAAGMQIHFLGHTSGEAVLQPQTCTDGEADGLQLHVSADASVVPTVGAVYYDDLSIGAACTTAAVAPPSPASPSPTTAPGPAAAAPGQTSGSATEVSPTGLGSSQVSSGPSPASTGTSPLTGSTGSPVATTAPATGSESRGPVGLEAALATRLVADRVALLYAVFGLMSIAVLLGAKPFVKPRLPREG
jgi:hypothetical protein